MSNPSPSFIIETFTVGPLQCNCSIIACPETKEAIIVDPGGDAPEIKRRVKAAGLKVKYLVHTHAHFDHIGATAELKRDLGAKILLHPEDKFLYDNIQMQGQMFGMALDPTVPVDEQLTDEMCLDFGQHQSLVLHTPGHTPGSVCFHLEGAESHLFSGDTLFKGSVGRTDLWGGSAEQLMQSIKQRLLPLDDSTTLYPGHGTVSTLWHEKKNNPFLR